MRRHQNEREAAQPVGAHQSLARACAVPLFCYLLVTIVVPLGNGAAAHPGFWQHAVVVVLTSASIVLLLLTFYGIFTALRERVCRQPKSVGSNLTRE